MNKPICVFTSPIFTRSGYGDWGLAVAKSLQRYDKFDLHLAPTRWGNCSKKNLEIDVVDDEEKRLLSRILRGPLPKQPELYIQCTIPNEFQPVGKYNIGMTAGIETTICRGEWVEGLNRMDMTVCTSQHAKDVFMKCDFTKNFSDGRKEQLKVSKPLEVCFWGAETNIYKKTDEKVESLEEVLSKIPEEFAFLFVGQWTSNGAFHDRKDIGMLIKTFLETFRDKSPKPCLILKTNGATMSAVDKYECINRIKEVTSAVTGDDLPNIYILHGELTDKEMNALYNHSKVKAHVSFTHGEGYGHPLLLASLSGKPLMVPQWSGHLDFLNPKFTRYLKGDLVQLPPPAVNDWLIKESAWFQVNYAEASEKMKTMYYNYGGSFLADADALAKENSQKYSVEAMDKVFHALLDKYVPVFAVEQPINLPKLKKIEMPHVIK